MIIHEKCGTDLFWDIDHFYTHLPQLLVSTITPARFTLILLYVLLYLLTILITKVTSLNALLVKVVMNLWTTTGFPSLYVEYILMPFSSYHDFTDLFLNLLKYISDCSTIFIPQLDNLSIFDENINNTQQQSELLIEFAW